MTISFGSVTDSGSVTKRLLSSRASKAHGSSSWHGMACEFAHQLHLLRTVPLLFSSCLALRGALDRDAQKPFCYASSAQERVVTDRYTPSTARRRTRTSRASSNRFASVGGSTQRSLWRLTRSAARARI